MSKDGVMTTEDFAIQKSKDAQEQEKKTKPKKPQPSKEITDYLFPPMEGKDGSCAFYWKGEEKKLKLKKGIFRLDKKMNAVTKQQYARMLPEVGFVALDPVTPTVKKEVRDKEFTLMHPDHSPEDPINGPFIVKIGRNKKQVTLEIENGLVSTKDERVVTQLRKAGFVDCTPEDGAENEGTE